MCVCICVCLGREQQEPHVDGGAHLHSAGKVPKQEQDMTSHREKEMAGVVVP